MRVRRKRLTVGEIRPVKSTWPIRESRKAAGACLAGGSRSAGGLLQTNRTPADLSLLPVLGVALMR